MNSSRFAKASCRFEIIAGLILAWSGMQAQTVAHPGTAASSERLHLAVGLAQRGDPNRALALTEALLVEHPDFGPALEFEAKLLEQMGQAAQAGALYEKALKLTPSDPELMLKVGIDQLLAGNRDQAIENFSHRLKLLPHDGDTLYYLAQAYHLKGDNELALKTIRECLRFDRNNASVWQKYGELLCSSGDNESALHWLSKAQHADPTLERIEFDLGVASYNDQKLEEALRYATKAAERRPRDPKSLALLAAVQMKLEDWQAALPVFREMLADTSDDTASLLGLGHCELEMKDYRSAADTLEKVLAQDPTEVSAHFYLSRAYAALGRTADAQHEADLHSSMLERASATGPKGESDVEKLTLQQAHQLLLENRETEALQLFREHSKGPYATAGEPYALVGALYLQMGKPAEAKRCLDRSMTIDPRVRGAHTYLGIMALQEQDLAKAEDEFQAELAAEPNYQLARAELGEVRYRQGRWSEAADQLARSRTGAPYLLYMLCDSYFHLGKVKEADLAAELIVDYGKSDHDITQGVLDLLIRNQQTGLAKLLANKSNS